MAHGPSEPTEESQSGRSAARRVLRARRRQRPGGPSAEPSPSLGAHPASPSTIAPRLNGRFAAWLLSVSVMLLAFVALLRVLG